MRTSSLSATSLSLLSKARCFCPPFCTSLTPLGTPRHLLCDRVAGHRPPPSSHQQTSRETVHSVLPLSDPRKCCKPLCHHDLLTGLTFFSSAGSQIRPLRRRCSQRPKTLQYPRQRELRSQDLRLWLSPFAGSPDDRLRQHTVLQSTRNHAHMAVRVDQLGLYV